MKLIIALLLCQVAIAASPPVGIKLASVTTFTGLPASNPFAGGLIITTNLRLIFDDYEQQLTTARKIGFYDIIDKFYWGARTYWERKFWADPVTGEYIYRTFTRSTVRGVTSFTTNTAPFDFQAEQQNFGCYSSSNYWYTLNTATSLTIGYTVIRASTFRAFGAPASLPVLSVWDGLNLSKGCNDTTSPHVSATEVNAPREAVAPLPMPSDVRVDHLNLYPHLK